MRALEPVYPAIGPGGPVDALRAGYVRRCHRGFASWLTPAAWVAAVAAVLLLVFPVGFPNYDTIYALVWGRELAHGVSPDYGAALPPTPHPLADLLGLVTTPLGDGAITVTMIVAYVSLGLIGYLVYRLGSLWFDRWVGAVAAVIVLTRAPFLSNGLRAYVDLPYIALCLGALMIETQEAARRLAGPRAARPGGPAAPRGLALRARLPGSTWRSTCDAPQRRRSTARARPLNWRMTPIDAVGGNWGGAGSGARDARLARAARPRRADPLGPLRRGHHRQPALLADRDAGNGRNAEAPDRARSTSSSTGPRALGEVLQWPGMVGGFGGLVLGFAFLRRRSALGIAAVVLALARLRLPRRGGPGDHRPLHDARRGDPLDLRRPRAARLAPARRATTRGAGAGRSSPALVLLMFLIWLPNQWDLDSPGPHRPHQPGQIESDLTDLVDEGAFDAALRADRGAQPPRRAAPRLRPRSASRPTSSAPASRRRGSPPKRLLRRARQPLRDPQLHPRPQRPTDQVAPAVPERTRTAGFTDVRRPQPSRWKRLPPLRR